MFYMLRQFLPLNESKNVQNQCAYICRLRFARESLAATKSQKQKNPAEVRQGFINA